MKQIGEGIRALRHERGMSLSALAAKAGMSKGYLSQVERGQGKRPGMDIALALARALGVPAEELFSREEKERPRPLLLAAGVHAMWAGEELVPVGLTFFPPGRAVAVEAFLRDGWGKCAAHYHHSDGGRPRYSDGCGIMLKAVPLYSTPAGTLVAVYAQ